MKRDVRRWLDSNYHTVSDKYKKPSNRKIGIEVNIKQQMLTRKGTRYRVLGGNGFFFTCAYAYKLDNKWYLNVEYPSRTENIELTEEEVREACLG